MNFLHSKLSELSFSIGDYNSINYKLMDMDQAGHFNGNDITTNDDLLYGTVNELINTYVPLKSIQPSTYPDQFSKEMISKIIYLKRSYWESY